MCFECRKFRIDKGTLVILYIFLFFKFYKRSQWTRVSIKALDRIYTFHYDMKRLYESDMASNRIFYEFWLPILSGIGQHCYHPLKEVRQHAFSLLQKALMSEELQDLTSSQTDCFDTVLFPLLDEVLKSDVLVLDPHGMDETRMRASALLCKTFLHFLPNMSPKSLLHLWTRILDYLSKYMNVGQNDYLVILYF